IVQVQGHGARDAEGRELWIALDLVQGVSLAERLAREGPLNVVRAAPLLARIARALHAGHTRGVIHRDVKPANILIDSKGDSWLIDFGIARFVGQAPSPATPGLYA